MSVDLTPRLTTKRPEHGGNIDAFCARYGYDRDRVLDLSTGISPWCWPISSVPENVWQHLPSSDTQLLDAASGYYRCETENVLPVAGSQAAIETLPLLAAVNSCIAVPETGYAEHGYCWARAGHKVVRYQGLDQLKVLVNSGALHYALVINPNNPGTEQYSPEQLLPVARQLAAASGMMIVDEAFVDAIPELSLARYAASESLLVLRSIGKFFGLAGLRLGFVIGPTDWIDRLNVHSGLWSVSGPALWLGARMLSDSLWIERQTKRLRLESEAMLNWAKLNFPELRWRASTSFVTGFGSENSVLELQSALAQSAILVRTFVNSDGQGLLRLGLADKAAKQRLAQPINTTSSR